MSEKTLWLVVEKGESLKHYLYNANDEKSIIFQILTTFTLPLCFWQSIIYGDLLLEFNSLLREEFDVDNDDLLMYWDGETGATITQNIKEFFKDVIKSGKIIPADVFDHHVTDWGESYDLSLYNLSKNNDRFTLNDL